MSDTVADKAYRNYFPPAASGVGSYDSVATSVASAQTALWATLGSPNGYVWVEFENADATDSIYIFLNTSAAGTVTANNGYKLTPGHKVRFWVAPRFTHVVNIASANTPRLKWRVASPMHNRKDQ